MSLTSVARDIREIYEKRQSSTEIIVEPDTSLTFLYGRASNRQEWNLPNSFLTFRDYQSYHHEQLFLHDKRFHYLAWCRRLGKEVTSWSMLLKYCFLHRCTGVIIYPDSKMGSRILWEGKMSDKKNQTTIDFLDFLPPIIDRNKDINDTVKRIDLPNGSDIWLLGAENYEKLRGINPQIAVLSEYSFQDPRGYENVRPIIAENNGVLIVQTTFDGRENHGYQLYNNVKDNPAWCVSFLKADTALDKNGERYIKEEEIQAIRDEGIMAEHKIQREFFMDVSGDTERYVFAEVLDSMEKLGCFQKNVWRPGYPVFTFWDIGIEDANAVIYVQFIENRYHIVHYQETQNKSYEFEIGLVDEWRTPRNISLGKHFLPHDGKNRSKMVQDKNGDPMNALQYISQKICQPCEGVRKPPSKSFGSQLIRSILPQCIIDEDTCAHLKKCLSQHKKEYDENKKCFTDAGVHDWTSHGVKALQTLAIAIEDKLIHTLPTSKLKSYINRGKHGQQSQIF